MRKMVTIVIDGRDVTALEETSLLKVLLREGFDIPHLCFHEKVTAYASCRLCLVEVEAGGARRIATSCNYPVVDGLKVHVDTEAVLADRATVFEVLLAQAPDSEKLRAYASRYGVTETTYPLQEGACILCGLCERVCSDVIGAGAIGFLGRGGRKELGTPYGEASPTCIGCGACAYVCPTGCITVVDSERDMVREIPYIHACHELLPCRLCGRPVSTKAHVEYLRRKGLDEVSITTCDECKKRGYARLVAFQGHM